MEQRTKSEWTGPGRPSEHGAAAPLFMVVIGLWMAMALWPSPGKAERPELTENVPVWKFQDKGEAEPYDYDGPPKGIFRSIQFSEDFEHDMGFRRSHEITPVNPTDRFRAESPAVFLVFQLHQHYEPFQVIGLCFPEAVEGLDPGHAIAEDAMEFNLEDESGYLQFFAPPDGWKPGEYKVEVHLGWEVNQISLVGTMRFRVIS